MELMSALIWTLRIVLPIILSCIFFKWQSSKEEQSFVDSSSGNKYSRGKLLAYRRAVDSETVPDELATLSRKTQLEAPQLFGGEKGRGKGGGKKSREKEDRNGKERRPREEKLRRKEDKSGFADLSNQVADGPSAQGAIQIKESEDKMNLESFLNYVAFNKKAPVQVLDLSDTNADKANAEAQMVLRGALTFKRVDVAKELYEQLTAANVDISSKTFSLMIEASVSAQDLKTSSDFLMKMESSGHSPSSELLDKILDLYSNQKPKEVKKPKEDGNGGIEEAIIPRQKLKSDARIFVPSFGIPPPPPKPKQDDARAEENRTKLTATAKPFEPCSWMLEANGEGDSWEDQNEKVQTKPSKNGKKEEVKKMWKPKAPPCAPEGG